MLVKRNTNDTWPVESKQKMVLLQHLNHSSNRSIYMCGCCHSSFDANYLLFQVKDVINNSSTS